MRALVRETRVAPGQLVLPVFVRDGIDRAARRSASMPGVVQHTARLAAPRGRQARRRGRAGRDHAVRRPADADKDAAGSCGARPDGILNRGLERPAGRGRGQRSSSWPTPAWTSSPTTATAACWTLMRPGRQRRHPGRLRAAGGRPGGRRRPRRRAVGDDGRPGARHPFGAGSKRGTPMCRSWPTRRSTPRRSTGRSARPSGRRCRATGAPTSRIRPTAARGCARRCSTSPRAPTW